MEDRAYKDMEKPKPQALSTILENMTVSANRRNGLYIWGPAGCGKTTIAKKAFKQLNEYGIGISCPEMLLKFRECFRDKSEDTESDLLDKYAYGRFVFIDDFGAEKNSEFVDETLYLLLNRIDNKNIIPIITSNYSLGKIAEIMSDRIASRIAGMCDVVEINDVDYRTVKLGKFLVNDKNRKAIELCQGLIDWAAQKPVELPKIVGPKPQEPEPIGEAFKKQMHEDISNLGKK